MDQFPTCRRKARTLLINHVRTGSEGTEAKELKPGLGINEWVDYGIKLLQMAELKVQVKARRSEMVVSLV